MLRRIFKNKKAQNTAEYALLIALVVAAIIAIQTYASRALQSRVRDASHYLVEQTNTIGTTSQYEAYYQDSNFSRNSFQDETQILTSADTTQLVNTTTHRGGTQTQTYNATTFGLTNGY